MLTSKKGLEKGGVFGDDLMAAAPIERLMHHCHLVTIAATATACGNTPALWHVLHPIRISNYLGPTAAHSSGDRDELRLIPLGDLSDFHSAELSDFG